jgi:crotonobetainyl-CoA:carnitine CoA-transferase CaiB-like acyl-CoA transferase
MRVVEISDREEAAAYAAKLLARWGSEVVKVESPARTPPPEADDRYLNGGKRRLSLDVTTSEDRDTLAALIADADIVITDHSPADTEAWQLLTLGGGSAVRVSITPFGLSGPYRDYPATASTLLAIGGYTFLSGDIGREPLTFPGRYPYYQAGTYAYTAAVAAHLRGRDESALTTIEVSVLETITSLHQFTDTLWTQDRIIRSRHGNRWENLCPTTMVACADGWVAMNIIPTFWAQFALMLGRPELADHPDYADNAQRMERCPEIIQMMVDAFANMDRATILREGQETWRVPIGSRLTLGETIEDAHLTIRDFWRPFEGDSDDGPLTPGTPFRYDDEPLPLEHLPRAREDAATVVWTTDRRPATNATAPAHRPLEGVRVVDLTRIWSGPLSTRMLGELGAEVIKIEAPTGRGPLNPPVPEGSEPVEHPWNRQALNNKLNRNKKSLAVDLKTELGRELFLQLVAESDVVIENFSARAMPSLGLDYENLKKTNPNIIYVAMPAFGLTGPYREYVGLGPSIEPLTGMDALMGYGPDEPRMSVQALTDAMSGTVAASAVVTALERRTREGKGAFIELSQHECGILHFGEQYIERQLTGEEPEVNGNAHPNHAPWGVYRCAGDDQWLTLAVTSEQQWTALANLAAHGWATDPAFATIEARLVNREALNAAIEAWTTTLNKLDLMHQLAAAGIPAGAVNSSPEWLTEPHLTQRGYFFAVDELDAGPQSYDGSPLHLNGTRGYDDWRRAPGLGEHRHEVVEQILGRPPQDTATLYAEGIIADRPPA